MARDTMYKAKSVRFISFYIDLYLHKRACETTRDGGGELGVAECEVASLHALYEIMKVVP